jgi:hypothetical protein
VSKFTPGPWHVGTQGYWHSHTGRAGVHYWIESLPGCPIPMDSAASAEAEPNARLIAASPDLLAACRAVLRYDGSILGRAARGEVDLLEKGGAVASGDDLDELYNAMVDAARAAIAKAEGTSP